MHLEDIEQRMLLYSAHKIKFWVNILNNVLCCPLKVSSSISGGEVQRSEFAGERSTSDWNNALKIGLDAHTLQYPSALQDSPIADQLPRNLVQPGGTIACISASAAERTQLPKDCEVAAGTTDSIAATLASGVSEIGEAVSSLGSTLAIKLVSDVPVDDSRYGVYSHRLGASHIFMYALLVLRYIPQWSTLPVTGVHSHRLGVPNFMHALSP